MSIVERLNADLKAAMKDKDTERLATLRMAISAMNYRRIERSGELSESATTGQQSISALATPVTRLAAPGPLAAMQALGFCNRRL